MIPVPYDVETFCHRTGWPATPVTPRSPWPSELLAFAAFCEHERIDLILESGTYHGHFSFVMSAAVPDATIVTIESDPAIADVARLRLAACPQVHVRVGDGRTLLPGIAKDASGRVGVFLDGPKSLDAVALATRLIGFPRVRFVACHDMYQSVPGMSVMGRAALEEFGRYERDICCWATDDPEWVAATRHLDVDLEQHQTESHQSGWKPYTHIIHGQPTSAKSYGPTMTFLYRAENDQ